MGGVILYSVICLVIIAVVSAIILYLVAKKFKVEEDPRIDEITEMLPGANCGGCGYPGCRGLAEAVIKAVDSGSQNIPSCTSCSNETRQKIGAYLGLEVAEEQPKVAVVRCGGTFERAPKKTEFDGPSKCSVAASLFSGEKGCAYGCLGLGDCAEACPFGAITMNKETGLPVVDEKKCRACGVCVKTCPRKIIELRPRGKNGRRVCVRCRSLDKGAVAVTVCKNACIGCGKCAKECPEKIKAITVDNFLAYIDPSKCMACGKCVAVCPTKAIKASFEIFKNFSQQLF